MHHKFLPAISLAALSLAVATMDAADEKTVTITDKDKDAKVELVKGDTLLVKLPANLTTGFTWVMATKGDNSLKTTGKPLYQQPSPDKKLPGGGGTQVFAFTAAAPGTMDVELHYIRPFEKGQPPAKTFRFKVTIK